MDDPAGDDDDDRCATSMWSDPLQKEGLTWAPVYVIGTLWLFVGIAHISEDYFAQSIERIIVEYKIPPSVAGATLMAAGSSSPELIAEFVGVLLGATDTSTGTVIGSAIFNQLVIVGLSIHVAPGQELKLDWRSLARDMGAYAATIAIMVVCFRDGKVTRTEALAMLLSYVVYVVVCAYWDGIEKVVCGQSDSDTQGSEGGTRSRAGSINGAFPITQRSASVDSHQGDKSDFQLGYERATSAGGVSLRESLLDGDGVGGGGGGGSGAPDGGGARGGGSFSRDTLLLSSEGESEGGLNTHLGPRSGVGASVDDDDAYAKLAATSDLGGGGVSSDCDPESPAGRWAALRASHAPLWRLAYFAFELPFAVPLYVTLGGLRARGASVCVFCGSLLWLVGLVTYMIVWLTKSGCLLGVSSTAMGLTFGAAGTSMPDCLVSLHVARKGEGNMAVSNVFGSNVFDVLFALGLPWVYATWVMGDTVAIDGSALLTEVMVGIFALFALHLWWSGFRQGPGVGKLYLALYALFFGYCFFL